MPPTVAAPRVAVLAVTFRGTEVALVQRRNPPQRGSWGFPGGSIELGESIHDAVLRELREETALSAEVLGLIDVVEVREADEQGRFHHFVLVAMLCRYTSGDLCAGDDAADSRWLQVPQGLDRFHGALVEHVRTVAVRAAAMMNSTHSGDLR
ncbi:MAG: NUDIX hydrolase [Pyrinomonadaceae bacterium]|nr:NUDIX hydrolase [Phycisphaerales bacterium]